MVKSISLVLLALIALAGCGDNTFHVSCDDGRRWDNGECVDPNTNYSPSDEPSILNKWTTTATSPIWKNPNLTSLALNTTSDADALLGCTGSYGNNVVVNTMTSGQMRVQGSAIGGLIQFGNVKYYGMDYTTESGSNCKNISKEGYIYSIRNGTLTLCLANLAYPYCTSYTVSQ